MVYGLRHAHLIGKDVPIVYEEDRFSILPAVAELLCIDMARFTKLSALAEHVIETAYLPAYPSFYWSSNFVSFFRSAAVRRFGGGTGRPIYVSRQRSKRAGAYEDELANALADRGFQIVHAQELSVSEQIALFTNATCIVAPHGAGLANAVFARSGTPVIEIFDKSMVAPDFHQRMKFVTENYQPVVDLDGSTVGRVLRLLG